MKIQKKLLTAAIALACCMPAMADHHEGDSEPMMMITEISIKHGHAMKFRTAMSDYIECYGENGGNSSWSAWTTVDGAPNEMWFVSTMDMWSEMDADDPGSQACWSDHMEGMTSHIANANRRIYRRMGDWSGQPGDFNVVKLHNFRVEDNDAFREVVGEMSGMMLEDNEANGDVWWGAVSQQRWGADYFVVEHFENFADMDEERMGPNDAMVAALGEEGAAEMWDRFGDTLADMEPYWNQILRRNETLSFSQDD